MKDNCARTAWPWQVLLPFAAFLLHSLPLANWIVDDAGISFAYSRNLVRGWGLIAQPGAEPVEGFSNPLWTLLLTPLFLAEPRDPTAAVKVVSLLLVLGTFFLIGRIIQVLLPERGRSRLATLAVLLLLSINTSFVVWTTSGLENPLYCLLIAACALHCVRYADEPATSSRTPFLAGLAAAGVALTRPDGVAYLPVFAAIIAAGLVSRAGPRRLLWHHLAVYLAAALSPVLLYAGFRYAYFGDVVPNTYHAKGGPGLAALARLLRLDGEYRHMTYDLLAGMFPRAWILLIGVLVAAIMWVTWSSPRRRVFLPLLAFLACSWAIYCLLPIDWMGEYRFATPFFMLFYIVLVAAGAEALRTAPGSPRVQRLALALGAVLLLAQSLAVYLPRTRAFADRPTGSFAFVARTIALPFNNYADLLSVSDGSLLCPDVGATLYYSRLRIHDLGGLCDRTIGRYLDRDAGRLCDYVLADLQPTFICIHDSWCVRTGLQRDPRFRQLYISIREIPCEWAKTQGEADGLFDGQYVRRDAIRSVEALERLRLAAYSEDPPATTSAASAVLSGSDG